MDNNLATVTALMILMAAGGGVHFAVLAALAAVLS